MISMKKTPGKIRIQDACAALVIATALFCYREHVVLKLNEVFLTLFGKDLDGRNPMIRAAVLCGVVLLCLGTGFFVSRRVSENEKASKAVLLLMGAVPLLQCLVICANQTLRRDDYWEIADARLYGFPGSILVEIRKESGRFLSWSLKSLHAVFDSVPYIDIFLFLNLLLFVFGCAALLRILLRHCGSTAGPGTALLYGGAAAGAGILLSSNPWEVWFWGAGGMIYGIGITLCVLAAVPVLKTAADKSRGGKQLIFPAVICLLACGGTELATASLLCFLLIITVWDRIRTGHWDKRLLFYFFEVCFCCCGILFFSGSMSQAGTHVSIFKSGIRPFLQRFPAMVRWMFNSLWGYTLIRWKYLLVCWCIFVFLGMQCRLTRQLRKDLCITALLLVTTAHLVLMINAVLDYMPPRVVTVGICWLFGAAALLGITLGSFLSVGPNRCLQILSVFLLLLMMSQFYCDNIENVRRIREGWLIRDAELQPYIGSDEPVVTCSLPTPGSFNVDISDDPENIYNVVAARYYRVPAILSDHACSYWE